MGIWDMPKQAVCPAGEGCPSDVGICQAIRRNALKPFQL
jgi:hypothetical protein